LFRDFLEEMSSLAPGFDREFTKSDEEARKYSWTEWPYERDLYDVIKDDIIRAFTPYNPGFFEHDCDPLDRSDPVEYVVCNVIHDIKDIVADSGLTPEEFYIRLRRALHNSLYAHR